MESVKLLKEEINSTLDSLHDFAKWKLIVTAALASAALGLTSGAKGVPPYWLLLFVPFACAYVDLNSYQYLIRIFVIARFLRKHRTEDPEEQILAAYEQQCEEVRPVFALGEYAQVGASLVFSLLSPALAVPHFTGWGLYLSIAVWVIGVGLVIGVWRQFKRKSRMLSF